MMNDLRDTSVLPRDHGGTCGQCFDHYESEGFRPIDGKQQRFGTTEKCRLLTERLLGVKPTSWTEPEVTDLIGEIANMVSGDMKRRTAELGYNGLLAPPLIMQGDGIVVESQNAPISAYNLFRISELGEELGVRVFAKLEA
jgi:hypothetical protein